MFAEPILGWTQSFMLDDKIINSIIRHLVNVRVDRNRSIVSRIKFIPMFIYRDYPNMFTFDG